ncbi:head-tail connector protein [Alcaligenes sp. SDU_A2]|uniref:head-tail connector protein n=1 Tax=Alcaligenes sp. SDU_A2 TaxID=3136634 RepID=UPI003120455B
MALTLERVKSHLRVDDDYEDADILTMVEAAKDAALDYLNRDGFDGDMPPAVEAAILLQVGDLYTNRERQANGPFHANRTYERLLAPYRVLAV